MSGELSVYRPRRDGLCHRCDHVILLHILIDRPHYVLFRARCNVLLCDLVLFLEEPTFENDLDGCQIARREIGRLCLGHLLSDGGLCQTCTMPSVGEDIQVLRRTAFSIPFPIHMDPRRWWVRRLLSS